MVATTELEAHEVMTRKFLAVAPEHTLGEVAEKLAAMNVGSALVVEYGHLTGILTSRDILHAIAERVHPSEGRVREWMTAEPVTASPDLPADEAARLMLAGGFHHLPVTEEKRPIGVIGLRAVIGALRPSWPGL
jgi:CBS domain-containing protein